ncbi:MAG: zf-TFIIB domain-containing protein [Cyclobacteriaceae bacterium]|nr:zf-TFIIB domain-containing protein [Cyclobacteriaceae bacterium]MCK5707713.1 zf-TFIIB domain-containing protein [Candidatus Auribacterota bacterium]
MKCPSCQSELKRYNKNGVFINTCPICHGSWVDDSRRLKEYIVYLLLENNNIPVAKVELHKKPITIRQVDHPKRSCPVCNCKLTTFNYGYDSNIILDKCDACNGLWMDKDELFKIAVYLKGNPTIEAYGDALVQSTQERIEIEKKLNDLEA